MNSILRILIVVFALGFVQARSSENEALPVASAPVAEIETPAKADA